MGPGIGAHVAAAYAGAGANVVLAARSRDRIEHLATELVDRGHDVLAVPTDVSRPDDLERLVAAAEERFGAIDIVFNNAHANPAWLSQESPLERSRGGETPPDKDLFDYSTEDWQACFDVNVLAPYRLAQAVVPRMKARGSGVIVTVLSATAFKPTPPVIAYGVTKSALHMMTRYLAKACGPEVRVNALCPATISPDGRTPFRASAATSPLGRIGAASETVGAALFLASDASSYSTGQVVFVDGGRVNAT